VSSKISITHLLSFVRGNRALDERTCTRAVRPAARNRPATGAFGPATRVGRIAVVVDEFPIVLPVNYRLIEAGGVTWVAIRTRPGNVIDRASMRTAFEIDGIDTVHHEGWFECVDESDALYCLAFPPWRHACTLGAFGSSERR
jgi:pyridoxamine 5'-phosphate oxidase-like protein